MVARAQRSAHQGRHGQRLSRDEILRSGRLLRLLPPPSGQANAPISAAMSSRARSTVERTGRPGRDRSVEGPQLVAERLLVRNPDLGLGQAGHRPSVRRSTRRVGKWRRYGDGNVNSRIAVAAVHGQALAVVADAAEIVVLEVATAVVRQPPVQADGAAFVPVRAVDERQRRLDRHRSQHVMAEAHVVDQRPEICPERPGRRRIGLRAEGPAHRLQRARSGRGDERRVDVIGDDEPR